MEPAATRAVRTIADQVDTAAVVWFIVQTLGAILAGWSLRHIGIVGWGLIPAGVISTGALVYTLATLTAARARLD